MREGAIPADIAAELGQRDEDLGREGDERTVRGIPPARRGAHQRLWLARDERKGFLARQALTVRGALGEVKIHAGTQARRPASRKGAPGSRKVRSVRGSVASVG